AGHLVYILKNNSSNSNVEWNLKNEAGRRIASGMYIAHIEVPGVGEKVVKFAVVQGQD
ncbi:MAG: hypothetical protein HND50_22335, partial [Calditrichaeota bacterium]|nr:hypothetical protein [Calditrichota bacterium]NOG47991.1 hypothetical protein [Calditrichota bacterium]